MRFSVELAHRAKTDVDETVTWLIQHGAGGAALSWLIALDEKQRTLAERPDRCPHLFARTPLAARSEPEPSNIEPSHQ